MNVSEDLISELVAHSKVQLPARKRAVTTRFAEKASTMSTAEPTTDTETAQLMSRLEAVEAAIERLNGRNRRVELEKAWEVSGARVLLIAVLTYLAMNVLLWSIGGPFPPVHALVPTLGFVLSTCSVPWVKRWWCRRVERSQAGGDT